MPAQEKILFTTELLLKPAETKPLSYGLNFSGESAVQSDSQSTRLSGNWHKRENTEHSDTENDPELHALMEDIKRYIRSIDISNL